MSDYVPQPGDTQVREIIRIVPHAKLDDAVELFVDGLKSVSYTHLACR